MTEIIRAESGGDSLDLGHHEEHRAPGDMDGDECANCGHSMDDHDGDEGACSNGDCDCTAFAARAAAAMELRYAVAPLVGVDVRDPTSNDDGTWTMSGYAAVFDQQTTLHDGRFVQLTEDIDPAAFDRVLREQRLDGPEGVVHFNFGHDMTRAVAATDVPAGQPGSLMLRADSKGLFYLARVARDDPDAVAMAAKMRTGVLKQASFAFMIGESDIVTSELGDGRTRDHRRIGQVGRLFDVCATPQGAYPQTVSQLRSYAAALGQPTVEHGGRPNASALFGGGVVAVSPERSGGGVATRRLSADQLRGVARHKRVRSQ